MSSKNKQKEKVEETQITEPEETVEKVEEKIDPRVEAILMMNRNRKMLEKDKQAKIYSAMHTIKIVRS